MKTNARRLLLFAFALLLTFSMQSVSVSGQENKSLSEEEARNVLMSLMPDVRIISIEKAVIPGLWQIAIQSRGQKGIVYLDDARQKVIFGSIVDIITKKNITKEKFDEINTVDVSLIPLDDAIVLGDKEAKHKVIVFDDPD